MVIKFAPREWERVLKTFQKDCDDNFYKKMDYELWKQLKRESKDKCVYIDTDTPLAKKNNSWAILSVEHPAEGNCFRLGLDDSKNSIGKFLHENWDCFDYLQHKTKDD